MIVAIRRFRLATLGEIPRSKNWCCWKKLHDSLLFFEWNEPSVKGILSSKIFEYIFSGRPILSIGASVSNSANEILKKSGTGIILNRSVEEIENVLKKLLKDKTIAYNPNLKYIERFHKRELSNKFIFEINKRIKS